MKKNILIVLALTMVGCVSGTKPTNRERKQSVSEITVGGDVSVDAVSIHIEGMEYKVIRAESSHSYQGGVGVINVTKDKLEVELLRKQMESFGGE